MSKKRKKSPKPKPKQRKPKKSAAPEFGLQEIYQRASEVAERGDLAEARRLYEVARTGVTDTKLKALICNDLATLSVLAGDFEAAKNGFKEALAIDAACEPARINLAMLETEQAALMPIEALDTSSRISSPIVEKVSSSLPRPGRPRATKVVVLSFLFNWPSTGGGTVHTYELAKFLSQNGYDVRHIYTRFAPWGIGGVQGNLPYPSEILEFAEKDWSLPAIQARVRQAVQTFAPDHVIITDSWNIKPLLAEAVRGFPYILRFQAMECFCPLNNVRLLADEPGQIRQCQLHQLATPRECTQCVSKRGQRSGSLHQVERTLSGVGTPEYHEKLLQAFREAEAVLVVNPLHEAMVSPYTPNVRVVTSGMDPTRFPWPPPDEPQNKKKVIFFAGLVEEMIKGFEVLHEACAQLWKKRQDFELVATGDPPGQVDAFTRFIGWQTQEDLPRHLRGADMLVMPTIAQEALGRTAVEAMAAGKPVIASRLGGLPYTVADGATGLLCEPGDPADLAKKIEILLDDPDLRRRLGLAGRHRFEEHYSWDVIIKRHYLPLLGPPHTSPVSPNGYSPRIPEQVDTGKLLDQLTQFFYLRRADVEGMFGVYRAVHDAKKYAETLGEQKTLCFEEAFGLYVLLATIRPRTIVEIGTQHGKSTRRILDIKTLLGLPSRVVCFDVTNEVQHFTPAEAELIVKDVTGKVQNDVVRAYEPGLIFLDVHAYGLLKEVVTQTVADPKSWTLAIHDCGRGLCNPHMTLRKDDPNVTSSSGVWERHVLAEVFGIPDPLSGQLDSVETPTHRLRIFDTPHGLGVLVSKGAIP